MVEERPAGDPGQLEFRSRGTVTRSDHDAVLFPALETALQERDRVRVLAIFGADFDG